MQELVDKYFDNPPMQTRWANGISFDVPVPTISGLALYLGFCDRHSLYDYEKNPKFSHTVKVARARMVAHLEALAQGGNAAGAIFMLKNFGYSDKTEVDINAKVTKMDNVEIANNRLDYAIGNN